MLTFAPFMFEIPEPLPLIRELVIEFKFEIPETFREVRIPTEVTLGWEGWETTRATLAWATFPTKFEEFRLLRPDALPM